MNLSSLIVLPSLDMPSFATAPKTLRRQFECPKKDCLECDVMLLLQDLMRAKSSPTVIITWNRPLVASTIIVSTLHGKLFILFFTVYMTKSRISILHCVSNASASKHSSLTVDEMIIFATHPVHLWTAVEWKAKSRHPPFTITSHTVIDEYARVSPSTSCSPSTLSPTPAVFRGAHHHVKYRQHLLYHC